MAAAVTRGDGRTKLRAMRVETSCCNTRVAGLVNPNALHDASFVSVLVYVETKAVLEAMRMILQRGSSRSVFGVSIGVAVRAPSTSQNREAEAETETQNDGIATELSVSQYNNYHRSIP